MKLNNGNKAGFTVLKKELIMDFFICLIGSIIVVLLTAWLIFSNYELRQQNHELLIDNCKLFKENTDLHWQLAQSNHELKLFKAEFCTGKPKNKVCHESSLAKN